MPAGDCCERSWGFRLGANPRPQHPERTICGEIRGPCRDGDRTSGKALRPECKVQALGKRRFRTMTEKNLGQAQFLLFGRCNMPVRS